MEQKSGEDRPRAAVRLPFTCSGEYPFTVRDGCFRIQVNDLGENLDFEGKVVEVYYGFTPKSKQEYRVNVELPWFNSRGEAAAEGKLAVSYRHSGDYKGFHVMEPLPKIEVPEGMNLVFRLRFEKNEKGGGWGAGPVVQLESKAFFVETSNRPKTP